MMKITALHYSRILVIVVFLALLRTSYEIYRLHALNGLNFSIEGAMPYNYAIFVCGSALLVMNLLQWAGKYSLCSALGLITVVALILIKFLML